MRALVVSVVVLLALALAADRVAAVLVADEAEQRLVAEGFVAPSVTLHGFPFLTQLAGRRFERVTVEAERLEVAEGTASGLTAELGDVRGGRTGPVQVGTLAADGTVPYDVVESALAIESLQLAAGEPGEVEVSRTVEALGATLDLVATARVEVRGNSLRIVPTSVGTADSELGEALAAELRDRVTLTYPLPDLPEGLQVEAVTATADGFDVRATGQDLTLRQ